MFPSSHLKTETDIVYAILCFLLIYMEFRTIDKVHKRRDSGFHSNVIYYIIF
jgi:hypothetical protein